MDIVPCYICGADCLDWHDATCTKNCCITCAIEVHDTDNGPGYGKSLLGHKKDPRDGDAFGAIHDAALKTVMLRHPANRLPQKILDYNGLPKQSKECACGIDRRDCCYHSNS